MLFTLLLQFVFALDLKQPIPNVSALNAEGKTTNLKEFEKENYFLVYFYPKADTPGCTAQACSLRDSYEKLGKAGVTVVGVSTDTVEDQAKFKKKYKLPFTLLSDDKQEVARAFSVPVRLGFTSRQAYLFKKGKLHWKDESASTAEQAQDVLKIVEAKN